MPDFEMIHDGILAGALSGLRGGSERIDGPANRAGPRTRRPGLRAPGRTLAWPDSPSPRESATPTVVAATNRERPAAVQGTSRLAGLHERTADIHRTAPAHAAFLVGQAPEAMLPAQIDRHAAFLDHEHDVAASFAQARAGEPGLTCNEWSRRNPFMPAG